MSFDRVINYICNNTNLVPKDIMIQHGYTKPRNHNQIQYIDFIDQNKFIETIKKSEIIISHGGAGTIINCLKYGKKPIVVPRLKNNSEHINDHQKELCYELNKKNLIFLIENQEDFCSLLKKNTNFIQNKIKNDPLSTYLSKIINESII